LQSRARQVSQLSSAEKQPTPGFVLHQNPWSPIQLYSIYRLILVGLLQLTVLTKGITLQLGTYDPLIFEWVLNGFTVLSVVAIFSAHFQWPSYMAQVYLQPVTDIIFLLLLIFSSGGLHSGMGCLSSINPFWINYKRASWL